MSLPPTNVYLLEGMMERGLPFVAAYLKKKLNRPVIITDNTGYIHYPSTESTDASVDNLFITLPPGINEEEYYYQEEDGSLFCQLGHKNTRAFVIIKNLPKDMISKTIPVISEARLAINNYFFSLYIIRSEKEKFEKKFAEDLFIKNSVNIRNIIKMCERALDINKNPYFVLLAQIDEAETEIDLGTIRFYTVEYAKKHNVEFIPIYWDHYLMFFIPALYREDTLEMYPDLPKSTKFDNWKKAVENKFNIVISAGLGQMYTIKDLHKSYIEARIALVLPGLMGKKGFIQRFSDLGIFSFIFSQDEENVKKYCQKTLGPLVEHDEKTTDELLPTLRKFLDSGLNWKVTADSMFIHVNTLRYRVAKIEQLLDADLSSMNDRVNLYTAIKVWDTLKVLGFLN